MGCLCAAVVPYVVFVGCQFLCMCMCVVRVCDCSRVCVCVC